MNTFSKVCITFDMFQVINVLFQWSNVTMYILKKLIMLNTVNLQRWEYHSSWLDFPIYLTF